MKAEIKERIEQVQHGGVPSGYIYTRAMLFPTHWSLVPLNSVLQENKERNESGLFDKEQVLSVSGECGIVNQIEFMGRSYAGESVLNYHVVYPGNIVYTKSPLKENPYGIIKLNKGEAGIVSTLYAVYHCESPITGLYLDYYFSVDQNLNNYLKPLVKRGAKNDMKVNNEDAIKGLIPLPSIIEQEKIVEIISHCDKVIELKRQLIVEKRDQKKWLMQNLLDPNSGVRLPGFEGDWKESTLEEICTVVGGGTPDTRNTDYWNGDIPWISSSDITEDKIHEVNVTRYITEKAVENSATRICPQDTILVVSRVGVGKIAIAPFALCTSQDFTNLTCVTENVYFTTMLLKHAIEEKMKYTQGTSIKGITVKEIKAIVLQFPSLDEQNAIADVISTADREIDLLEQELAQWQTKKKSLMQLLLTGIVRVEV